MAAKHSFRFFAEPAVLCTVPVSFAIWPFEQLKLET
jgi:hypothetical protein